jgi:hypothetical protein
VDLGAQYISASPSGQSRYKVRIVYGTVPSSLIDLWYLGLVEWYRYSTVLASPFLNGNCLRIYNWLLIINHFDYVKGHK